MKVEGMDVGGYRVLRAEGASVPNAIAAFLLYLRDRTGKIPHAYFHWGSKNSIAYLFDYVVLAPETPRLSPARCLGKPSPTKKTVQQSTSADIEVTHHRPPAIESRPPVLAEVHRPLLA